MGAFGLGTALSWTSPGMPSLEESKSFYDLDDEAKSWIGAIVNVSFIQHGIY